MVDPIYDFSSFAAWFHMVYHFSFFRLLAGQSLNFLFSSAMMWLVGLPCLIGIFAFLSVNLNNVTFKFSLDKFWKGALFALFCVISCSLILLIVISLAIYENIYHYDKNIMHLLLPGNSEITLYHSEADYKTPPCNMVLVRPVNKEALQRVMDDGPRLSIHGKIIANVYKAGIYTTFVRDTQFGDNKDSAIFAVPTLLLLRCQNSALLAQMNNRAIKANIQEDQKILENAKIMESVKTPPAQPK